MVVHLQASQKKHAHNLQLLLKRALQLIQKRHGQDQNHEIRQDIESRNDRRSDIGIDTVVRFPRCPIRIDWHALEYRSKDLSDAVGADENGHGPYYDCEAAADKENAVVEIQK